MESGWGGGGGGWSSGGGGMSMMPSIPIPDFSQILNTIMSLKGRKFKIGLIFDFFNYKLFSALILDSILLTQ